MLDFEGLDYSDYDTITIQLNENLLEPLLTRYNTGYATENFYHLPEEEDAEDKPESIRGRISLLIEYALISILHETIEKDTNRRCAVTFNTVNMFADFFIRSNAKPAKPLLRVDIKTFHKESIEASARFDTKAADIDQNRDYLLIVRWDWDDTISVMNGKHVRYPKIQDAVFVSCQRLAEERDLRQRETAGGFDREGGPLSNSGTRDTNFGKLNRMVSQSRSRNLSALDPYVRKLYEIVKMS